MLLTPMAHPLARSPASTSSLRPKDALHVPASEEETPGKAKRIHRPAHWKTAPAPIASAAQEDEEIAPPPAAASHTVTLSEWRDDPAFLLRVLVLVALVNVVFFGLFPFGEHDRSQMSETYTPIRGAMILPDPKPGKAGKLTLYAPAPHSDAQLRAPDARVHQQEALEAPDWLRRDDQ